MWKPRYARLPALILFICLLSLCSSAQAFQKNICDSSILTSEQLEKCQMDSFYSAGIPVLVDYMTILKTKILPRYRLLKSQFQLTSIQKASAQYLKKVYDSTLSLKISVFEGGMDKNQKYIMPKAFISSQIAFSEFRFYPNIYAILLNDLHLALLPKTTQEEIDRVTALSNELLALLDPVQYNKLLSITKNLQAEIEDNRVKGLNLFGGILDDQQRMRWNVVNFLIWQE